MKYFVNFGGKQYSVLLVNPPKDMSKLDAFEKVNGSAIIGTPDLFVNLKKDGTKYRAFALKVSTPTIIVDIQKTIDNNKKKIDDQSIVEVIELPEVKEVEEEQLEVKEVEAEEVVDSFDFNFEPPKVIEVMECFDRKPCPKLEEVIKKNIEQTKGMVFAHTSVNSESYIFFQKEKNIWIKRYGSEQLNIAHDMHMRCDKGYITERASREFPEFTIFEEFGSDEIDTPDISILVFLKKEAFSQCQSKTIKEYGSRIVVATDEEASEEENPFIVIKNYLGHCDLAIRISDLIEDAANTGRLM